MSTNAYVCKEVCKDKYQGVLINLDGYPTNVGALLLDYYNDRSKVDDLLSHGDISSLKERLVPNASCEHSQYNRQKGVTYFFDSYYTKTEPKIITIEDMCGNFLRPDYSYIYGLDRKWRVYSRDFDYGVFEPLDKVVKNDFLECGICNRPFGMYGFFTSYGQRDLLEADRIYG